MASFEARKAQMLARLEARKNVKAETEDKDSLDVDSGFFERKFWEEYDTISKLIGLQDRNDRRHVSDQLDGIVEKLQLLQKFLAESTQYLSAYECRKAQDALQELQNRFQSVQSEVQPKKKFAFKARSTAAAEKDKNALMNTVTAKQQDASDGSELSELTVRHRSGEKLVVGDKDTTRKDVLISECRNLEVSILGCPSTLHLAKLSQCTVKALPVSTSVFVDDCADCVFVLACQQLRMHSSKRCSVYLHVTSSGIVEDCSEIKVAPYSLSGCNVEGMFGKAGLDQSRNNWSKLEDFDWLASDKPSPNWSIIPESGRMAFEV